MGSAQSAQVVPSPQCVERLRAPDYPWAARQGRAFGTLKVTVTLSSDGGFKAYRFDEASAFASTFGDEIGKALKLSKFSAACAGQQISLVFTFGFETADRPAGVFFGPPNRIDVIIENPPLIGKVVPRPPSAKK
jgi:outer membrane biosynthesis protein TonB